MKKIFSIFGALLVGAMMSSCNTDTMDEVIKFGTEITASVEALAEFASENAEAQTLEVTANGEWMVVAPAWLEVTPTMGGEGTTTVTVKARDNKEKVKKDGEIVEELGPKRSAVIQFVGEQDYDRLPVDKDGDGEQDVDENGNLKWQYLDAGCEVKVSQNGDPNKWDPAVPRPVTIKYFNEVATVGDGFIYELTGKITEVANTVYGNFYFDDGTDVAYVYGLLTPDGEEQKQWAAAGLKVNDIITVRGSRGYYASNSTTNGAQMSKAIYVSHVVGEASPIVDATIAEFLAAEKGGTQYRISGVVTSIAKAEYGNIYLKDATGEVYVYGIGAQGEFETMGIEVGDIVTLLSNRGEYNGTPQAANSTLEKKIDVTAVASVTDFLALEESGNYYMLSGTVSGIAGAGEYGNIYLNDETSSIYVYGLLSGYKGAKQQFPALVEATGLKDGDTLTIIGKRSSYNDTPQVGSAFYFSHEAVEGGDEPEPEPVEPTVITIPELYAKAAEATGVISKDVTYVLNVVVSGASQNSSKGSLYVMTKGATEAGNGFLLYDYSLEGKYNVGDELKVTLPAGVAQLDVFNGNAQVKNVTAENIEVLSTGNVVNNIVVTADKLIDYLGMPVTVENASVAADGVWGNADSHTSLTFTAGGTDFTVYINKRAEAFHGVNYYAQTGNISGIAVTYKGSLQLAPRDAEDVKAFATAPEQGGDEPSEVTAYTMTLGVTAGEDGKFAPNSNISGLVKSHKEHTWTATDDSGKDTITFTGDVYYKDGEAVVWYYQKKYPGTTVYAEGFGKLKKITITLLGEEKDRRLPALFECKDKEGNVVASNETEKSLTMTYEFANATDGFTLTGKNDQNAEDSNYQKDLKVTSVVIEYEK